MIQLVNLIASSNQVEKTKIKLMASGEFTKVISNEFKPSLDVSNMGSSIIVINVIDLYDKPKFKTWLKDLADKILKHKLVNLVLIYDPKMYIVKENNPVRALITGACLVSSDIEIIQGGIQTSFVKSLF